jgi:hypothetical protein
VALHDRISAAGDAGTDEALPPYMESFLAHIRMLVGVPFEYLIPDDRLLPPESIRFFYVDRSWTDRLVDGAVAVGQIGSREAAHYQARAGALTPLLDQSERMVRPLQRKTDFVDARAKAFREPRPADVVTGFILRSSAVSHWPHMDVRAYPHPIAEPYQAAEHADEQLKTLRIERLAPAVLIAVFEREPQMVILEEPHHGVQFGIRHDGSRLSVPLRKEDGQQIRVGNSSVPVTVPTRPGHGDVVRVAALRDALEDGRATFPAAVEQTGSGSVATAVLDPPWRQHFEGTEDHAHTGEPRPPKFVQTLTAVRSNVLLQSVKTLVEGG